MPFATRQSGIERSACLMLIALLSLVIIGCNPSFDDETSTIVMRPKVLSIVLDPPEAAPGQTVTASYLAADQFGTLVPSFQIWTLASMDDIGTAIDSIADREGNSERSTDEKIGFGNTFTFTVPPESEFRFDEQGLAPLTLTLLFPRNEESVFSLDMSDPESMMMQFSMLLESGEIEIATRTLVVSTREEKNRNPRIKSIKVGYGEEGERRDTEFVCNFDEDISLKRRQAAENPFVHSIQKNNDYTYFTIELEDEGDQETNLRLQWIATDGDFSGRRDLNQRWISRMYIYPFTQELMEIRQRETPVAREDPNLLPIWVVIRDNGKADQLGQSWAEFYVRITD